MWKRKFHSTVSDHIHIYMYNAYVYKKRNVDVVWWAKYFFTSENIPTKKTSCPRSLLDHKHTHYLEANIEGGTRLNILPVAIFLAGINMNLIIHCNGWKWFVPWLRLGFRDVLDYSRCWNRLNWWYTRYMWLLLLMWLGILCPDTVLMTENAQKHNITT